MQPTLRSEVMPREKVRVVTSCEPAVRSVASVDCTPFQSWDVMVYAEGITGRGDCADAVRRRKAKTSNIAP